MSMFHELMMKKKGGGEVTGYIEASGGAYINLTGIPLIVPGDTFSCTFQIPNLDTAGSSETGYIFGYQTGSMSGSVLYGTGYGAKGFFGIFGSSYTTLSSLTPINSKLTYGRTAGAVLSDANTIWLFASNYSGGEYSNITIRFWNLSYFRSDEKIIDLVPAIENGVAGVKDLISGNFYGKSGSGTITFVPE